VSRLLATTVHARDLKSDIDSANRTFRAAYDKGDAAAIARLYTPHAKVFPPDADIATGRDAIQKVWAGMSRAASRSPAWKTEEYGDVAREVCRFTGEAPDAQKRMTKLVGGYVVIWKRISGTWMLDSDIWNLNH
jgi:ketosteroid isomerase-like protein